MPFANAESSTCASVRGPDERDSVASRRLTISCRTRMSVAMLRRDGLRTTVKKGWPAWTRGRPTAVEKNSSRPKARANTGRPCCHRVTAPSRCNSSTGGVERRMSVAALQKPAGLLVGGSNASAHLLRIPTVVAVEHVVASPQHSAPSGKPRAFANRAGQPVRFASGRRQ